MSNNIFIDVLKFALEHNKELLYTLLCHTTTASVEFDESTVVTTANLYMSIASTMNPNHTNTFKKLQGIILQSCGLNDTGLTVLSKLGHTITSQQLLNTRTQLAVYDESSEKAMAKHKFTVIVLDNLDREVKKVIQHQTLPVLLSRDVPHIKRNATIQRICLICL